MIVLKYKVESLFKSIWISIYSILILIELLLLITAVEKGIGILALILLFMLFYAVEDLAGGLNV